ncbi:hypothetical protein [Marinospirillum insulare]|uniref:Outer membrane protein beta-barrel domain-containing protein n=1 Tax=Marinospirillum insulare TaxID=217169 RepID=A0ABQ5ZTA2_9GAMM|nr:hypothetical protein [Marinospirillum insulare]GLR63366.1 hypothetical protein GCM10007878_08010 [Marinospirillum insulare]
MKKITLLTLAASFLLAATAKAEDDSALFLTPSLGYTHLTQKSNDADYELSGNIYMLNADIEVISNGMAYHRLSLGHNFTSNATQEYASAEQDIDVDHSHASYRVGVMNLTSFTGDFSLWTGLGWQGTKMTRDVPGISESEITRMHYMYVPFGIELALHHAANSYWVIGSEYRLVMRGWEKYQGLENSHPQQTDMLAYSAWLGMDYITSNKRALTTRLSFDQWKVESDMEDDIADGSLKLINFELGVRF